METAREVIEQVFGELAALLGPNDRLIISMRPSGNLYVDLIDIRRRHSICVVANGLDSVINVLAARIQS